eukprot:6078575-Pyramimonas_sp.AAC.1
MSGRAAAAEFIASSSSGAAGGRQSRQPVTAGGGEDKSGTHLPRASDEPSDHGAGLRQYLLQEWQTGTMNAKQVCVLAYWATRGGATGVADLALRPDSSHFAGHLKGALNLNAQHAFYMVDVPMWCKGTESRITRPFPINLPHEFFASHAAAHPEEYSPAGYDPEQIPQALCTHP